MSVCVAAICGLVAAVPSIPAVGAEVPGGGGVGGIESVWQLALKGGILMIPLGVCSLVALAVIVERLVVLRRARVLPPGLRAGFVSALDAGTPRARELAAAHPSAASTVLLAGLERWDRGEERMERAMRDAGEQEVACLRARLRAISVIAGVAPLMGLLGTIFGMITAFRTVASAPEALGKVETLAGGIYEAMVTTAAGLIIAIPCVLAHHALAARVDRFVMEIEGLCARLVEARRDGGGTRGALTARATPDIGLATREGEVSLGGGGGAAPALAGG